MFRTCHINFNVVEQIIRNVQGIYITHTQCTHTECMYIYSSTFITIVINYLLNGIQSQPDTTDLGETIQLKVCSSLLSQYSLHCFPYEL